MPFTPAPFAWRRVLPLLCGLLAALASPAAAQESLTGVFHLVWRVAQDPRTPVEVSYHLTDDRGRSIRLRVDAATLEAQGGALRLDRRRVSIEGTRVPAAFGRSAPGFEVRAIRPQPGGGDARASLAVAPPQSGSKAYVTVLCKFADSVSVEPRPRSYYEELLTGTARPSMDHYWRELSDGRINLGGSRVVGWYTLPGTRASYFPNGEFDHDRAVRECTGAADADVDFRQYFGVNMQFNLNMPASWGGYWYVAADGVNTGMPMTWMAAWAGHATYGHEIGHSLGLPHSSGPYTQTYDSRWDVMSGGSTWDPTRGEGIGHHTVMYHKDVLGWVPAAQRLTVNLGQSATVVLERNAQPGTGSNYQLIVVPLGNSEFYTIEARRVHGYDAQIPGEGVVLHRVNPSLPDRAAQVVDADANGDPNDQGAVWTPGETFFDAQTDLTVTVGAATSTGYTVTVTRVTPPLTLLTDSVRPDGRTGVAYRDTLRAAGGNGVNSWTVVSGALPPGVTLGASTGVLAGTPSQGGTFRFSARVQSGSASATGTYRIQVIEAVRVVSDSVRVPGRLNTVYTDTLRAVGGDGKYSWSLVDGSLPPGVDLTSSTGVLAGAPAQVGTYRFSARANSMSMSATASFVMTVVGPLRLLADSMRPGGLVGAQYLDSLKVEGGLAPRVWRMIGGALPPGLVLDSLTGRVSGIPNTTGEFYYAVEIRAREEMVRDWFMMTVARPQLAPAAVVDQLLSGTGLTADQARYLDMIGNRNGRVDVGDVRAWLQESGQANLSEYPLLQQILAAPGEPAARPVPPNRGEP